MQTGLLAHLAHHRGRVVLPGLDPPTRHGPPPAARLVGPSDQQQAAVDVVDETPDTGSHIVTFGHRCAPYWPACRIPWVARVLYKSVRKRSNSGSERWYG
ncbi:hypothetical protein GCM10010210_38200 [Pseudonocardia hydrocarbonoxydans]|uniref:Uncharacterized protein n=1 Tax=Pseudonocardia hydrocarbonoxydans TaxID=76726 RepID=A0A4Y3WT83_9PSEU|nr:hypothetical protein PHY01_42670 [Pseudonocardia hydrocarbonoxydans]